MGKFRTSKSEYPRPESIEAMFQDLNRDSSIKFLHFHQGKILEDYCKKDEKGNPTYMDVKDLAIELPTGTGKTLVGLLIAEYRRRVLNERVVFLCPTKQLCSQVNEQAKLYGINTALLVGHQKEYDPGQFYAYQQAKSIAITTYSGIFNSNPRIKDPEVIICDDAHTADNYISDLWTLSINRSKHQDLYMAMYRLLEAVMPKYIAQKIESQFDEWSVDLLSTIAWYDYLPKIGKILEEFASKYEDLKYSLNIVTSHLEACSIYLSPNIIEIRPLIPPTQTHQAFSNCKQHIYMSATLGEDGEIERVFGVKEIVRLIHEGWHKRSTGRRLILFPGLSANQEPINTAVDMVKQVERCLVLVPDNKKVKEWEKKLQNTHVIITSEHIEQNLDAFTKSSKPSVLILATRYDGIDLPGEDCRFMILDEEPSASDLQEFYLRTALGASSQLHNRIRTRITQGIGRCTRDESDYSVVFVLGDKLTQRFCTKTLTEGMNAELQAEIAFGLENSTDHTQEEFIELAQLFLNRSPDWQDAEQDIRKRRNSYLKAPDPTTESPSLKQAMPHEIDYVYASWKGQHEDALNIVAKILASLERGTNLKPYRAFWLHQAATSAFLAWKQGGNEIFKNRAISYLDKASSVSSNITWLGKLRSQLSGQSEDGIVEALPIRSWFLNINNLLQKWKIIGSNCAKKISEVENNIKNKNAKDFERGLATLGEMLGARSHQWKDESAAPDGLWIFDNWCAFVFEAKTDENPENGISFGTVRQADFHEKRVRKETLIPTFTQCFTIIISPRSTLHNLAQAHVEDIAYLSHDDVINLFNDVALAFEKLRNSASGSTEETLQDNAVKFYREKSVALQDIKNRLLSKKLRDLPLE